MLKPEKKFYDTSITQTTLNNVGTLIGSNSVHGDLQTLVGIPQGTTESQRIGRKCTITNIYCRFNLEFLANEQADLTAANFAHETVRMIMFWDKQANGAAGTSTDILETNIWSSFRNLGNNKRFVVLYDKTFMFNAQCAAAGNGTANDSIVVIKDYQVRISKKCFIPIEYLLTTGALVNNIASNNVGMLFWGKHGGRMIVTNNSRIKIRFIDY